MSRQDNHLWDYIIPLDNTLIVVEPKPIGRAVERRTQSGLYVPTENDAVRKTFGQATVVLRAASQLEKRFPVGSSILIHEFGGIPIYTAEDLERAWIIGESDIMAAVSDSYWLDIHGLTPEELDTLKTTGRYPAYE